MAKTRSRPNSAISNDGEGLGRRSGSGRWHQSNKLSGIRYKVCFSGKYDVGKSSIYLRLQGQDFYEGKPTCQTSTYEIIDSVDETVEYSIWDTNGLEEHDVTTLGNHYRNAHCILFVYDATDFLSLEYIDYELKSIEKNHYAPNSKYVLIQNKIDIKESKHIPFEKQKQFLQNSSLKDKVDLFCLTSAKTNDGISELFYTELPKLLTTPEQKEKSNLSAFDKFLAESLENLNSSINGKKKKKKPKCKTM